MIIHKLTQLDDDIQCLAINLQQRIIIYSNVMIAVANLTTKELTINLSVTPMKECERLSKLINGHLGVELTINYTDGFSIFSFNHKTMSREIC